MSERRSAPAVGVGVGYVIAAVLLLMHQLGIITLRWELALPAAAVVIGVSLVLAGAAGAWINAVRAEHVADE